jgi:hypothetical protein
MVDDLCKMKRRFFSGMTRNEAAKEFLVRPWEQLLLRFATVVSTEQNAMAL